MRMSRDEERVNPAPECKSDIIALLVIGCRVGGGIVPPPPTDPYVTNSVIRFVSNRPVRTINLAVDETTRRHGCCCPAVRRFLHTVSCAIRASFVIAVCGLNVPPAFPWHRRHARHCLPASLRLLSWVPWASVRHAFGQGLRPAPRYCALLRLPPSIPVGSLPAPFRYPGLTRRSLCPSRLPPSSAHLLAASTTRCLGVGSAGHPLSGYCSQGDGRLSRVPGLPFGPHAPLSDPGGVPLACLDAARTVAFHWIDGVGFRSALAALSSDHDYTFFGAQ